MNKLIIANKGIATRSNLPYHSRSGETTNNNRYNYKYSLILDCSMHAYLHNTYITEMENCFKHMGKAGTVTTITWNRHDINLTGDQIQCYLNTGK